ncbi:DUF4113 domain-containing protein [Nitrosospira multiformis]|uniref:DUF4113 domain-containing protein n=1 Tax=Nitrosospira multiformis TaxID=1231 RepID=UPI0015E7AA3D|nr:DUF4113 domain-containing protein [Nitrosospira multiformis]
MAILNNLEVKALDVKMGHALVPDAGTGQTAQYRGPLLQLCALRGNVQSRRISCAATARTWRYSINESFLDLGGLEKLWPSFAEMGQSIRQRMRQAMDMLNARFGRNTLSVFSSSSPKPWAMHREAMSPCYTTRWSDVPVVHAA